MKLIPLTQGKFAIVDDEDFPELSKRKWYAHFSERSWYAVTNAKKADRGNWPSRIRMHRFILGLKKGDKREGDHQDHNGLNCQRYNIRICTSAENQCNQRVQKRKKTSKYKGVFFEKGIHQWRAYISIKGQNRIHLGVFRNEKDAAIAYDKAAIKYHKEFACLNF